MVRRFSSQKEQEQEKANFPKFEEDSSNSLKLTFEYKLVSPLQEYQLTPESCLIKRQKFQSQIVAGARKESYFNDKTECYHPRIRENSVDSLKHNIRTIKIVCVV
ncbi:Hypothetical_protein [Hexamita inflata]|uniref:Hypothetical_protein n=1 Tax=Hexamita inflata TaxID=28002 RepID=A0ABP1LMI2_9EUKA